MRRSGSISDRVQFCGGSGGPLFLTFSKCEEVAFAEPGVPDNEVTQRNASAAEALAATARDMATQAASLKQAVEFFRVAA